ncbi:MAG: RNA 2',3'-cyclic phosphodiesterase [Candidatus Sungbacteria bacterium]|nr:RNA 2',3'-cyclic phosphodiesterase [Candidatus Sungbacteria bacterium]
MKRRIFIAIDLPPELKDKIAETIKQWRWLPIRWLPPENWHITLLPPVYLEDAEVVLLGDIFRGGRLGKPLAISFSRISLAPPGEPARMIWLEGHTPPELVKLKNKIENLWLSSALPKPDAESRPFKLHLTLARFEAGDLKEIEEKTRLLGETDVGFEAKEITIMESRLKPSSAKYEIIAAIPLAQKHRNGFH